MISEFEMYFQVKYKVEQKVNFVRSKEHMHMLLPVLSRNNKLTTQPSDRLIHWPDDKTSVTSISFLMFVFILRKITYSKFNYFLICKTPAAYITQYMYLTKSKWI